MSKFLAITLLPPFLKIVANKSSYYNNTYNNYVVMQKISYKQKYHTSIATTIYKQQFTKTLKDTRMRVSCEIHVCDDMWIVHRLFVMCRDWGKCSACLNIHIHVCVCASSDRAGQLKIINTTRTDVEQLFSDISYSWLQLQHWIGGNASTCTYECKCFCFVVVFIYPEG